MGKIVIGRLSPSAMWRISGLNAEKLGKIEALGIISAHRKTVGVNGVLTPSSSGCDVSSAVLLI
jgi:hypothetical protein